MAEFYDGQLKALRLLKSRLQKDVQDTIDQAVIRILDLPKDTGYSVKEKDNLAEDMKFLLRNSFLSGGFLFSGIYSAIMGNDPSMSVHDEEYSDIDFFIAPKDEETYDKMCEIIFHMLHKKTDAKNPTSILKLGDNGSVYIGLDFTTSYNIILKDVINFRNPIGNPTGNVYEIEIENVPDFHPDTSPEMKVLHFFDMQHLQSYYRFSDNSLVITDVAADSIFAQEIRLTEYYMNNNKGIKKDRIDKYLKRYPNMKLDKDADSFYSLINKVN